MSEKAFVLQRICTYTGREIDPCEDDQVKEVLQRKFNIYLPQRPTMDKALAEAVSDHEIIDLLIKYRSLAA